MLYGWVLQLLEMLKASYILYRSSKWCIMQIPGGEHSVITHMHTWDGRNAENLQCLEVKQVSKSWTNGSQVDLWKKPGQQQEEKSELRSRNVKSKDCLTMM